MLNTWHLLFFKLCHDSTQTWQDIIWFGLKKTRTDLFLWLSYIPKWDLPIKMWITPYKSSISLVLCRCGITPLKTQRSRWGLPHHHSRGHAEPLWYYNIMTQLKPVKILFALTLTRPVRFCFWGAHTPQNAS